METETIKIPITSVIREMSEGVCKQERTRLRNEIAFARGNAMWGGPSEPSRAIISACNEAIDAIETRLAELIQAATTDLIATPASDREWVAAYPILIR